jgi:hypothetical protein
LLSLRITQPTNSLNGLIQLCSKEHPTVSWHPMLTYTYLSNTPPVLAPITNRTIGVGVTLSLINSATDSDVPLQTLAFSLPSAPTNAAVNASNGVVTWRPLVTQANTTNQFTVKVTDSGTPGMNATQSFVVVVNPVAQPQLSSISTGGGQFVLQVNGDNGPDYQIQASTNLTDWNVVFATNFPDMPFVWTNSATNGPVNFFRIQMGPPLP